MIDLPNGSMWNNGLLPHQQESGASEYISAVMARDADERLTEDCLDGVNERVTLERWFSDGIIISRIFDYTEKKLPHPACCGVNQIIIQVGYGA